VEDYYNHGGWCACEKHKDHITPPTFSATPVTPQDDEDERDDDDDKWGDWGAKDKSFSETWGGWQKGWQKRDDATHPPPPPSSRNHGYKSCESAELYSVCRAYDDTRHRGPRPKRQSGAHRRGNVRPDRRLIQAGILSVQPQLAATFSQGLCLCQSTEITPSFIIVVLFAVIAMLVLYILYLKACKQSKPTPVAKLSTVTHSTSSFEGPAHRTKLPQVIYFSAAAMTRSNRSFHICTTCPNFKQIEAVCTAVSCKTCVPQ
jgi:hypothetical protein